MWDDGIQTVTSEDQRNLERRVRALYASFVEDRVHADGDDGRLVLLRSKHADYLRAGLAELPSGFSSLDASRPWICYWIIHSLALLEHPLPLNPSTDSVIAFLAACQHTGGGFGGGPYQLAHLATTYAAVAALVTIGGAEALEIVHRPALFDFFLRMCVPAEAGGGMTMHEGGEVDIRGCYCALAACHMLGMDTVKLAEACSLERYVTACQSMEGGIGGEPWNEAHGGYTFCGFAALVLSGKEGAVDAVDVGRLAGWASRMQGQVEGGFMGRTCKLVDGCYSLWQGGLFPLLQGALGGSNLGGAFASERSSSSGAAATPSMEWSMPELAAAIDAAMEEADGGLEAVRGLAATQPPAVVAASRVAAAQAELDAAVETSLRVEEEYKAAVSQHSESAETLKGSALATLQQAAEAEEVLRRAQEDADSVACSASELVKDAFSQNGAQKLPMYNPVALQLWLLACCQVPLKGGLRDKPGKTSDFYHTCYCLSGLASAQQASGAVLGGERNRLPETDPLCNVVAGKLLAARQHFGVVV